MFKKLYPLLSEVGSDIEKAEFKYMKAHKIHFTKGHTHKMKGPDGNTYMVRHVSIEMTDEELEAFNKEFDLHTI